MSPPAPTDRRRRRATLIYAVAASVVVIAAAALRFDGLGETSLGGDEAAAAVWSQGSLAQVFDYTGKSTSPILYPLALWLVQKVEVSAFSVRLLPALGSTLTVAALLFLLPSAGISRRAAFLSGTLAAISTAAIIEAHGVREYSLDALLAALLVVGMLRYARDGRGRFLLGTCLFLGPLVQYGLVLFGAAILLTAFHLPPPAPGPRNAKDRSPAARLRARKALLAPASFFFVGGALSWWTTLRPQLALHLPRLDSGRALVLDHLQGAYYGGNPADLPSLLSFLSAATFDLLRDWIGAPLVAVSLGAGALLLGLRLVRRKRPPAQSAGGSTDRAERADGADRVSPTPVSPLRVVLLLFAVSLAVAAVAAAAGIYPLGAGRHGTYLGPVIFTAAGSLLAAATTLPTPASAGGSLFVAVLGGIVAGGSAEYAARTDFPDIGNGERVARFLAEESAPDDLVYVFSGALWIADFYLPPRIRGRTVRDGNPCHRNLRCTDHMARVARVHPKAPGRLWIVTGRRGGPWLREALRAWSPDLRLHTVIASDGVSWEQHGADIRLYRIEGLTAAVAARFPPLVRGEPKPPNWGVRWDAVEWGEPDFRSTFSVWRREDAFVYRRAPCSPEDTRARFLLTLHPAPGAGTDEGEPASLDFFFEERGIREDGKCLAIAPIPEDGYGRFVTGQWSEGETTNWRVTGRLDEERYRTGMRAAAAGEWGPPLERSAFDLHLEGNELRYFKDPCTAAETEARFFVHLHPSGVPAGPGRPRHENHDFDFPEYGVAADGKCLAMVPLPADSRFHRLSTGQWRPGEPPFWRADLWFPSHPAALDSITSEDWGPPAARSVFDLHLAPDSLWYHRADCSAEDLESRFFLHLYPRDPADLPEERRAHGFENRDFAFSEYGSPLAGACLARVPFPHYAVARLRTGQFEPGGDPRWSVALDLPTPPAVE